ncbi:MAG: sensor histidine kinase [Peptoniphilaceae bacterium]|nr:sensor histidine kinase [Peptoniphilaceae bacterium]MDY6019137.1 sensor histidine kinase [Anaerococcus sp.]
MSKINFNLLLKRSKYEIVFFFIILVSLYGLRFLFPLYKNFIAYFSIIFIVNYLLMLFLSLRNDIKNQEIIKEWINKEDFDSLPDNFKKDITLLKIKDQARLIKSYEDEIFSSNSNLKNYITRWTHQIKSPIFALSLLLNDDDIDRDASKLELFEIEEYVQNILAYIRMDSDTTDYVFSEVDVDKEVNSSIKKYASLIISKNNGICFNKTKLTILSDAKWFRFILDQILSNANKYTRGGDIKIYLDKTRLVIEDSGIGIKEEDLPRIFEKGFTGFNGRLDKKATGIGLSLVKNICQALRIDVSAESKVNKGTKIILDLSKIIKDIAQ